MAVRTGGRLRAQALRAALAADQGQGRVGQPLPEPPARLRRRVHRVERPRRGGGPGRGPGELGAEPHHRPAARRAVHAGEGEPAAHREPPPPRVDGGRRERPDRPADHARQGRRQGVVRAQALHRPARERRGDARRPSRCQDGRRGGRRPRRRCPGRRGQSATTPTTTGRPSRGSGAWPPRTSPRPRAPTSRCSTRSEGRDGRRRGGQPLDQGAGEPLRARAARDGGVPARLREDGRRGRAGLRLRPRGDDARRGRRPGGQDHRPAHTVVGVPPTSRGWRTSTGTSSRRSRAPRSRSSRP